MLIWGKLKNRKITESYNHRTPLHDKELCLGTERLNKFVSVKKQTRKSLGINGILSPNQSQLF